MKYKISWGDTKKAISNLIRVDTYTPYSLLNAANQSSYKIVKKSINYSNSVKEDTSRLRDAFVMLGEQKLAIVITDLSFLNEESPWEVGLDEVDFFINEYTTINEELIFGGNDLIIYGVSSEVLIVYTDGICYILSLAIPTP